uniref:Uncharacterized protein n=1 Tax=Magallana gigas TaxID=29159 RepID=K1QL42_MAGGI
MAVHEVLPEEYDDLDQKLEKELPLSIHVGTGPFPVDEEEAPVDREDGVGGQLAGLLCLTYRG